MTNRYVLCEGPDDQVALRELGLSFGAKLRPGVTPDISDRLAALFEKAIGIDLEHLRAGRTVSHWVLSLLRTGGFDIAITSGVPGSEPLEGGPARKR